MLLNILLFDSYEILYILTLSCYRVSDKVIIIAQLSFNMHSNKNVDLTASGNNMNVSNQNSYFKIVHRTKIRSINKFKFQIKEQNIFPLIKNFSLQYFLIVIKEKDA